MDAPRSAGADAWARLERLERLARGLDSRFRIPGTGIRFGWDSIIGLVPGLGDMATLAPGAYIWLEGHRLGMPNHVKGRMAFNLGADFALGSIPVLGDLLDVGFKANLRNVALIREHLERSRGATRRASAEPLGPLGADADMRSELTPPPADPPRARRAPRGATGGSDARSRPVEDGGTMDGRATRPEG
jgi:hypothetical protein